MKQEMRTLNVAIRAGKKQDAFELHGTAVTYNALADIGGQFKERVAPGAFTRALADGKNDVKMLFNHSQDFVLGRQANGTLQIFDTPTSLNFRCQLNPESQAHRDLHTSIKRGDISECSFAFKPTADGEQWEDLNDERGVHYIRRTIKQADIFDLSCVTTPAYGNGATSVVARSVIAPHRTQKSLEQQFLELTGKEFVSDQDLRMRLANLGLQVKADVRTLAADKELRERVEAVGRRIAAEELFEELKGLVN